VRVNTDTAFRQQGWPCLNKKCTSRKLGCENIFEMLPTWP
jgi:hypothetical protein